MSNKVKGFIIIIIFFFVFLTALNFKSIRELQEENKYLISLNSDSITQVHNCWFCGNNVKISPINERYYIECDKCKIKTTYYDTIEELIDFWNRGE